MKKVLFSTCMLSFFSVFSMDSHQSENYVSRNALRLNVVNRINSLDTNIDMMYSLSGYCIDEKKAQSFIDEKTAEMDHLYDALKESDALYILASKIDASIECASALRGIMDDEVIDAYLEKMQKKYDEITTKSCSVLED